MSVLYVRNKNGELVKVPTIAAGGGEAVTVPGYWQSAVDAGVDAINTAMEAAGRNKSAFLWYTDAHWPHSSQVSPNLLRYLCENTAMTKVNFGGDVVNTEGMNSREDCKYLYDWRKLIRDLPHHHSVRGNHDDDVFGIGNAKPLYAFLMAPEECPQIVRGGDFYYYIDEPSEKTRYLYLDTSECWSLTTIGDPEMVKFVVDALTSLKSGWHVVAISHIWWLYASTSTPYEGDIPNYCKQLLDLFDAYNGRLSGTVTVNTTAVGYDFASGSGRVEFCIGGHTHVDYDFTSDGGIPVILTETDSRIGRSGLPNTLGTTNEASVNGIVADYDAQTVKVIRIGRGRSRTISLSTGGIIVPEATNVLKTSIDLDGKPYNNGQGWKADTRLNSSGAETSATGTEVTGFIEFAIGDVLRFKNMKIAGTTENTTQYIAFYNSAKAKIHHVYTYQLYETSSQTPYFTLDDNGNWASYNTSYLKGANSSADWSDLKYFRISAEEITNDSIITINEEIR